MRSHHSKNVPGFGIIFDLDGTLIDSSRDIISAIEKACEIQAIKIREVNFAKLIGPPLEDLAATLIGNTDKSAQTRFVKTFKRVYDSSGFRRTKLYPGIRSSLRRIRKAGELMFVATNKRYVPTTLILKKLKLGFFDDSLSADRLRGRKLSKVQMIKWLQSKWGFSKGCYVGDAPSDIVAARESGLVSIAVTYGYGTLKALLREKPDFIVDNPREIVDLVRGLRTGDAQ